MIPFILPPRRVWQAFAAIAALASLPAAAEDNPAGLAPGWYAGAALSASGTQSRFAAANGTDTAEYRPGAGITGFVGYRFGSGLRNEGEVSHLTADLRNIDASLGVEDRGALHRGTSSSMWCRSLARPCASRPMSAWASGW